MILGDEEEPGNPGHLVLTGGDGWNVGVKRLVWGSQSFHRNNWRSEVLLTPALGGGWWEGWFDGKPGVPLLLLRRCGSCVR